MGLSPDGGLFVPESIPVLTIEEIAALSKLDYRARAVDIMSRFMEEMPVETLEKYVAAAYSDNFDDAEIAPVRFVDEQTAFLELWHGPTCAFKDMALQMLPQLLTDSLERLGEKREVCILVATSGDTGKAALEGFAGVRGTKIAVFYPRDGVSDVQKLQMVTQTGENVYVCAVEGNFDDAQTGVKKIFGDRDFAKKLDGQGVFLSSANSINWGRLLPQIVYYFSAYCDYVNSGRIAMGQQLDFCVPTGNFGDILAGWYAKRMGLPVRKLICASNSNRVLTDFIDTGVYDRNREFYNTISPSMDILVSSNLERLLFMLSDSASVSGWMQKLRTTGKYDVGAAVHEKLSADFAGGFCGDSDAKAAIARLHHESGYLMDPHTAVAYQVLENLRCGGEAFPTVIVSTASPFKFCESVLDALGKDSDKPGTALLRELMEATGKSAPAPLLSLEGKTVRFNDSVAKEALPDAVASFLAG
jgi:threonine synthase